MKYLFLCMVLMACGEGQLGGLRKVEVEQLPGEVGKPGTDGKPGQNGVGEVGPQGQPGASGQAGSNGGSALVSETDSEVIFTGGDGKSVRWTKPVMPTITICYCTPLGWLQDTGPAIDLLITHFSDESAYLGPCRGNDGSSMIPEGQGL